MVKSWTEIGCDMNEAGKVDMASWRFRMLRKWRLSVGQAAWKCPEVDDAIDANCQAAYHLSLLNPILIERCHIDHNSFHRAILNSDPS